VIVDGPDFRVPVSQVKRSLPSKCANQAVQFSHGVGAEGGDQPVPPHEQWHHRQQVGEKNAPRPEGPDEGGDQEHREGGEKHGQQARQVPPLSLENGHRVAGIQGILQDAPRFVGPEVMKGEKEGANAVQPGRHLQGADGCFDIVDVGVYRRPTESGEVRERVGEGDAQAWKILRQLLPQPEPSSASSGSQVHDAGCTAGLQRLFQQGQHRPEGLGARGQELQKVGAVVAPGRRKPVLIFEFEKMKPRHDPCC
jgi:hypothetical protein